jgi:hypothetical protein
MPKLPASRHLAIQSTYLGQEMKATKMTNAQSRPALPPMPKACKNPLPDLELVVDPVDTGPRPEEVSLRLHVLISPFPLFNGLNLVTPCLPETSA